MKITIVNDNKVYCKYIANGKESLCLIIKCGCINEYLGAYGCAHVLEHMMIHFFNLEWKKCFDQSTFCLGKTEYDHILLRFDVCKNSVCGIDFALEIINSIIDGKMISEELFEMSKSEVVAEYGERESRVEEQNYIVSKLTYNEILSHPVGNMKDLLNLNIQDIIRFYDIIKKAEKAVFFMGDDLQLDRVVIPHTQMCGNKNKSSYDNRKRNIIEITTNNKHRFFLNNYCKFESSYMERIMLMNIFQARFENNYEKAMIYEKTISNKYRYIYLTLSRPENSEKIKEVLLPDIQNKEFDNCKQIIKDYAEYLIKNSILQNRTSIINSVVRNYLYDDDILLFDKLLDSRMCNDKLNVNRLNKIKIQLVEGELC
ncbi:MAG: insulinase family protein [Pseudobutyrivibrio sp.]|nr:insulinase family protein [Pseudobutyrivibrio sp.]